MPVTINRLSPIITKLAMVLIMKLLNERAKASVSYPNDGWLSEPLLDLVNIAD